MCRRECYYRAGLTGGHEAQDGTERMCNYATITGRTRTAELVKAYREKGRILTEREKLRILTDDEHCPWHVAPGKSEIQIAAADFFNSRRQLCQKVCQACGKPFAGGPRALYCVECRDEKKREKQKAWWDAEVEVICKDCGAIVMGTRHQKYCSMCRKKHLSDGGRRSAGHKGRGPSRKKESA